jgi:GTPase SAR1 family protein
VKLERPILVGGLGLSFSLWILQSLHHSMVQVGEFGLLSLLVVGGGLWLVKQKPTKNALEHCASLAVDRSTAEDAIAKAEAVVNQLAKESENSVSLLQAQIASLTEELNRQQIKLAVTGGKSVGKTTLIKVLSELQQNAQISPATSLQFSETSPLFTKDEKSDATALTAAIASDCVLFLTSGDLTDSEFQALQQLKAVNQSTMLVFNKQDQYLPEERVSVLLSFKKRVQENVVAIAASPLPIKVRKHQEDGSFQEWLEQPTPDVQQLTQQLNEMLSMNGQQLVWATTIRKALSLKAEAKNLLNLTRRDRALPIIEKYQWIAAAAAFANPVPALDLLATVAINGQIVVDLGEIYQQKFSLEQAQTVAATMGSLMLKLGLVELSSQAICTVLKSNAVTFVAGGVVQGVSAAYLTRIAGLTLIEYFQQQEIETNSGSALHLDKIKQTLLSCFQHNQQMGLLQRFVKQGMKHLLPESPKNELIATQNTLG